MKNIVVVCMFIFLSFNAQAQEKTSVESKKTKNETCKISEIGEVKIYLCVKLNGSEVELPAYTKDKIKIKDGHSYANEVMDEMGKNGLEITKFDIYWTSESLKKDKQKNPN